MFTELLPLLKERTVMLIIASVSDDTLRVNVIPQRKASKENDAAENAFTSPLTITGTAEELDREFARQIGGYRASFDRLKSNLGEIESAHAAAIKTIEEEKKKERASSEGGRAQWETVPPGKKSEPRSLDSREEGDRISEAYRQSHLLDGEQVTGP